MKQDLREALSKVKAQRKYVGLCHKFFFFFFFFFFFKDITITVYTISQKARNFKQHSTVSQWVSLKILQFKRLH